MARSRTAARQPLIDPCRQMAAWLVSFRHAVGAIDRNESIPEALSEGAETPMPPPEWLEPE
ncbi:MAG TPA: hypothetical protein PKC03_17150, partial [Dokdonella sp.]|nr:hypothetical protein [Dokdonella sp.]